MFDFHQKRKLRAVLNSPFLQGGLLVLVCLVALSAFERYQVAMEMTERRAVAEQAAAALEARQQALEAEVEYLSNERGIEAEVRRQFDVALPGERVVVIVEDQDTGPHIQPLSSATSSESARRWYQFWR